MLCWVDSTPGRQRVIRSGPLRSNFLYVSSMTGQSDILPAICVITCISRRAIELSRRQPAATVLNPGWAASGWRAALLDRAFECLRGQL